MTNEIDRNDPLSHPYLAELLSEKPPKELNSMVLDRYRKGVVAALTLPAGDDRQCLLNALNGAVNASTRVRNLLDQVTDLQVVLKVDQPDKSQMLRALEVVGLHIKGLHAKFSQVWDKEKKAGRDPSKGSWAWFEHELYAGTNAITYSARGLLISSPVGAVTSVESTNFQA